MATCNRLFGEGWTVRWDDDTIEFHGRMSAGGPIGWHKWSTEVPKLDNIKPRKHPGMMGAGEGGSGKGGKEDAVAADA